LFLDPPSRQDFTVDFERVNLYAYDIWRIAPWLSITGGVTYDKLRYPQNYRSPPIDDDERSFTRTSPKAGFILTPHPTVVVRGAYTEAISGASFDESVRLEPTQVAGFNQAYRTIISEDIVGSVAGATYKSWGLSLEQKLPTHTYWGIEYNVLTQDLDRTVGAFDLFSADPFLLAVLPSEIDQKLLYREDVLTASVNQLLGERWSLGSRYRYTKAKLRQSLPQVPDELLAAADANRSSLLHELDLFALYNHPSGFFARGEALWFNQENDGFQRNPTGLHNDSRPGDDFWQFNAFAGYRFHRNQCEVSCGVLNIGDTNYQLEPLNYYLELPRERTFFVRVKLNF
jgi:outer membrane receptor protein involved in Fe transport